MSCPTCDHTLECVVDGVFHCSRCGTLKIFLGVHVPKLVERCREFGSLHVIVRGDLSEWQTFGIAESIRRPKAGGTVISQNLLGSILFIDLFDDERFDYEMISRQNRL